MGIGEASATKIRHGVGFAPDHIIEQPVVKILQSCANAENIVIRTDHPQGTVFFQHTLAGFQPGSGKIVIGGEAGELIPVLMHPIDPAIVGA